MLTPDMEELRMSLIFGVYLQKEKSYYEIGRMVIKV